MDANAVIFLLLGAALAGGAVFFYFRTAAARQAAQLRAEAERDARAAAEEATRRAQSLKDEADKVRAEAESARRQADAELSEARRKVELEAREAALRARQEAEAALEGRRQELAKAEKRLESKEESLDRKVTLIETRESEMSRREAEERQHRQKLEEEERRYQSLLGEVREKLEKAAGLSSEDARREIVQAIEEEAKQEAARRLVRLEEEAKEEAADRARRIVGIAIQRYAGEYTCDRTVSVVQLPSDEMKGRIIGREGRNIRALEAATGIDIIIDDTPEAIILSGYNPVRREVARRAIDELVKDGRVHPARIEEIVKKHGAEVDASLKQWGEKAMFELGITGLHPEIVKLMGAMRYRTSYTQNQWQHSLEVGFLVGAMAGELGLNVKEARRAGFLHDLGKAVSHEVEGGHAVIGADLAKKYGESEKIVHAIRAHHDDVKPETVLAHLVAAGDAISGARPGARSENLDNYVKRLEDIERISLAFPGVERCFAVQAGREVRVLVDNAKVDDASAVMLSRDIAKKVEEELTYPGQIRITVIRETRAVGIAR